MGFNPISSEQVPWHWHSSSSYTYSWYYNMITPLWIKTIKNDPTNGWPKLVNKRSNVLANFFLRPRVVLEFSKNAQRVFIRYRIYKWGYLPICILHQVHLLSFAFSRINWKPFLQKIENLFLFLHTEREREREIESRTQFQNYIKTLYTHCAK